MPGQDLLWLFNRYLGQRIPPDAAAIGTRSDPGKKVGIVHPERLYRTVGQTIIKRSPGFSAVGRMKNPTTLSAREKVATSGEESLNILVGKTGVRGGPGVAGVFGKEDTTI